MRFRTNPSQRLLAVIIAVGCLSFSSIWASPIEMNYQGRLLNSAGNPVPDGDYTLMFSLYDSPTGGSILWEESQTIPVRGGLFSVLLGSITPLDFSAIHTTTPGQKYIEIMLAGEAPMTPRVKLATAPLAAVAGSVSGDIMTRRGQLVILDTLTGDTVYSLKVSHQSSSNAIRNIKAKAPSGDSSTVTTSVDPQAAKTEYIVVTLQDVMVTSTTISSDSSGGHIVVGQTDALGSLSEVSLSVDSSGASQTMRSGRKALCDWITEITKASIQDTSMVTVITDSLQATVKGKKKTGDIDTPSFFDITASDDGSIFTLGSVPSIDADTDLVVIRVDTSGSSLALIRKSITAQADLAMLSSRSGAVPGATLKLLPGNVDRIAMAADSGNGVGIELTAAKKVVRFKAGAALASSVNRMSQPTTAQTGANLVLSAPLADFVAIEIDSLTSSLVFADTLHDTTYSLKASNDAMKATIQNISAVAPSGATSSITSTVDTSGARFSVSQAGGGLPGSEVAIGDVDGDGDFDLIVGGNVGIGVGAPTNILTVKQGSTTDPIADAWTTYSSRRWKKNIVPIEDALDKVKRLRGVEYDWKANNKHDIGLIAEEVGKVIPEVVVYEENGVDAKSVDYPRLVALLIQALNEQQKKIDSQNGRIEVMADQLSSMNTLAAQVAQMQEVLSQLTSSGNEVPSERYGLK